MDTSLKNKKIYILVCIFSMYLLAISVLAGLDIEKNYVLLSKDAYFKSEKFKNQLVVYSEKVRTLHNPEKSEGSESLMKDASEYMNMEQSMKYYIKNKNTGEVYTNVGQVTDFKKYEKEKGIYIESFPQDIGVKWQYEEVNYWFRKNNMEGNFIFIDSDDSYSQIKKDYVYYNSIRSRLQKEIKLGIVCLLASLLLMFWVKKVLKHKEYVINIVERYDMISIDLRIMVFLIYSFIMNKYIRRIEFFYTPLGIEHIYITTIIALGIVFFIINMKSFGKVILSKDVLKSQWEESIIFSINKFYATDLICKGSMKREVKLFILTMVFGASIVMFGVGVLISFMPMVILTAFYILLYLMFIPKKIFKRIHDLNSIIKGTDNIVAGRLDSSIENLSNDEFVHIAENINSIQKIYKDSMEAKIKSERMKTELITNVSHDLKTPLTSIINYITLLKNKALIEEEKQKYLEILEMKSQRLKILIDDLFEVAKASSGTIEMKQEKVDIGMLLSQTLGELEDKIGGTTLTFRIHIPEEPVYSKLDGRRTWRVFENIIGNALKYSQNDSRVYVELKTIGSNAVITVKNVSNYEMNFEVSEIFERFKRGDKSRSTEGSGLGLSIAKSFVELQGGNMNIEIDGDLFKVIIKFPIMK